MSDTLIVLATIGSCFAQAQEAALRLSECVDGNASLLLVLDEGTQEQSQWFSFPPVSVDALSLSPTRRGIVGAYNTGFSWFLRDTTCAYLMLLEDGVRVTPGWDVAMRHVLETHPDFGWVACGQLENDRAPFTPLCSLMTRACAEAVTGLDPVFAPCQFDDADLYMRCRKAGFTPHAVNHKVSHPVSRTSRQGSLQEDVALMMDHLRLFRGRWGIRDSPLPFVPIHACERCT